MHKVDGYPTDVKYPAFFYKEMQPVWLAAVHGILGFQAPAIEKPFRFCELGCGIGINLLVAAASHPQSHFVGVDFNAQHIAWARHAAQAAGLHNMEFIHSGFEAFAHSSQAPFDFMTSHGVWSWIAPQHQASLLDGVKHLLHPQGVFYLHYMCHPGSTDLLTIQHMLHQFAPHVPGNSAQQIQMGLKLLSQLAARGAFHDKPQVLQHLQVLQRKDPQHLAHEFLTDHWQPQHGVDLHQQLVQSGLHYVGSADVFNNLDISLSIPAAMQPVVRQTQIPAMAEVLKDLARNSHQRMDLFQATPQPLQASAYRQQLDALKFNMLAHAPMQGPWRFETPIGPVEGPDAICTPLLQQLARGPQSFAQLAHQAAFQGQEGVLLQTLQLMMLQGWVHPTNPAASAALPAAQALSQWFKQQGIALQVMPDVGSARIQVA